STRLCGTTGRARQVTAQSHERDDRSRSLSRSAGRAGRSRHQSKMPPFEEPRKMTIPLFHVDAFTDRPFAGNPAAVCLLPSWQEGRWLQAVAGEMNLSETAFLVKNADG